jgi:hypothetical protein
LKTSTIGSVTITISFRFILSNLILPFLYIPKTCGGENGCPSGVNTPKSFKIFDIFLYPIGVRILSL